MLQGRLKRFQRDFAMELVIAVLHDDEHIQIGLGIAFTPRARAIQDHATHAIAEARS